MIFWMRIQTTAVLRSAFEQAGSQGSCDVAVDRCGVLVREPLPNNVKLQAATSKFQCASLQL